MNNAVTKQEPRAQLVAGAQVAALVPQTMEEAFRVANAIAIAGLAPKGLEKPEQILVAIMAGAELGFAPFQALQSFAVVNGKPTLWGDGLMAVVLKNGFGVKEWCENEADSYPDNMTAYCEVTRPDNGDVKVAKFSVADAKKASLWGKQGPWQTNPKRMLKMRARAFACRDGAADALKGFQMREEVEDFQPIQAASAPQRSGLAARLASGPRVQATEGFNVHHGQVETAQDATFTDRLNDVLDGDVIPNHDAETGEITDDKLPADDAPPSATAESGEAGIGGSSPPHAADDDDFPGGRPATQTTRSPATGLSLKDRIAEFRRRAEAASNPTKLTSIWAASAQLRNDIDAADPDEVGTSEELERFTNSLMATLEEAERAAKGGGR